MIHRQKIIELRFRELLLIADEEPVDAIMGLLMIALGIWLAVPWDTFGTMATYHPLAELHIPEWIVGAFVVALGCLRIYFILNNRIRPRRVLAVISGAFWGFNGFLAIAANPGSLLVPMYAIFLAASCWIAYRLNGQVSAE